MANYFLLELNTLPPKVTVVPTVIKPLGITEIRISADEILDIYQEIYLVDSLGNRHDIVFDFSSTEFSKQVDFKDFPLGNATLYINIRDEVDNELNTYKTLFIGTYSVIISIEESDVNIDYETLPVDMEVGK